MAQPWLSVVIPTYNEAANIGPLLTALQGVLGSVPHEFVVVDDDSQDGTPGAALAAAPDARVVVRKGERGLATAVVHGLREATGTYVAVMDADFQHPPEAVLRLLEKALATDADLVVGSRYADGGSQGNFGAFRRLLSWGAGTIGRVALPPIRKFGLTDPMSGLFLVRRDRVDPDALRPSGYKILLEIIGRMPLERVAEVGYTFQDRRGGESKLGAGVMGQYLRHVGALALAHPDNRRAGKFLAVGLSGALLNLALLFVLHGVLGLNKLLAAAISVEASILSNFLLNDRFTFHDRQHGHMLRRGLLFNTVSLMALAVNLLVLGFLADVLGVHYLVAEAIAIVVAFGVNYAGNLNWTYSAETGSFREVWRRVVPWMPIVLLTGAAAFVYVHDLDRVDEVYFDEHYYISVARQMDNGIWEDPCWTHDSLNERPLNYEHPPLAKLLMYWSVKDLDTDHAVFYGPDPGPNTPHPGCRSPDSTEALKLPCQLIEHGKVLAEYNTGKECYDAFTARARAQGNPFAWRLPSAILGTATVLFAALAGRRIFRDELAGLLCGSLVLLDTMVYTSARLAILDIFAAGFTVAAVWAATFPTKKGLLWSAIFLGLGFSSKYSVLFVGPAVLILALWSHRRAGLLRVRRFDLACLLFLVVPPLIWIATFWPWWVRWIPEHGVAWTLAIPRLIPGIPWWTPGHFWQVQKEAFGWQQHGYQTHPYASPPAYWFPDVKPTWYYHIWGLPGGTEGWVYAVGNPILWWLGGLACVAALLWVPLRWVFALRAGWEHPIRHVRTMAPTAQAAAVTALLPLFAYGGFFGVHRVTFLFYMTLVSPLVCLPFGGALAALFRRSVPGRIVAATALLLVLAGFLYYYPVAAAVPIQPSLFHRIMHTVPWMQE